MYMRVILSTSQLLPLLYCIVICSSRTPGNTTISSSDVAHAVVQNGWQNQSSPSGFQQTFYASPHGFPQQYALVPLNGGPGRLNGHQQHAMLPAGPPPGMPLGPGMGSPHMLGSPGMNSFKYAALHAVHMCMH